MPISPPHRHVGVFAAYPHPLDAQTLYSLFRPQPCIFYSIASAQDEVGEEVHLTIGVVRFDHHDHTLHRRSIRLLGRTPLKKAAKSASLSNPTPLPPAAKRRYPHHHDRRRHRRRPFRLLHATTRRQWRQRQNWLFFGNQRLADDFYQPRMELIGAKTASLTRADLAWSRQGEHKVYVQ